jgi:hypothetical protein
MESYVLQAMMKRTTAFGPKVDRLKVCAADVTATLPSDQRQQLESTMTDVVTRWQKVQTEVNRRQSVLKEAAETQASFDRTLSEMLALVRQLEAACVSPIPWLDEKLVQKDIEHKEVNVVF